MTTRRNGLGAPALARGGAVADASIDLYWRPFGAAGAFVRLSGLLFEAVQARVERRRPLDLYHTALEIHVREGRFAIEMSSIPDGDGASRGVVAEGPIVSRHVAHVRILRYELRCWQGGVITELDDAVASPQHLGDDSRQAYRLLELVRLVPRLAWGRDELEVGEMWNSNSVISWLLARGGLPTEGIRPPAGGRAPGWAAGLAVAAERPGALASSVDTRESEMTTRVEVDQHA